MKRVVVYFGYGFVFLLVILWQVNSLFVLTDIFGKEFNFKAALGAILVVDIVCLVTHLWESRAENKNNPRKH